MKKRELILYLAGDVVYAIRSGFRTFFNDLEIEVAASCLKYMDERRPPEPAPTGPLEVRNPIGEWTPNSRTTSRFDGTDVRDTKGRCRYYGTCNNEWLEHCDGCPYRRMT